MFSYSEVTLAKGPNTHTSGEFPLTTAWGHNVGSRGSISAADYFHQVGNSRICFNSNVIPAAAYYAQPRPSQASTPHQVCSPAEHKPLSEILAAAGKKALGGGLPGMAAMGIQVGSLMWLRTTVNYQYRYGTSTMEALRTLYKEGGVRRFYRGVGPALVQGPMSRFGDTAANAGTLALLDSYAATKDMPMAIKTLFASTAAAGWRIFLMPVDTCKTILQVTLAKSI